VLAERIEHFEEIKQKTYQMGERPAKIRVAESELKSEGGVARRTQGTDVAVVLTSGEKIEGELVSVRDSSVFIATRTGDIVRITDTVVSHVIVKGSSHVFLGIGLGFLGGMIVGTTIGAATVTQKEEQEFFGGLDKIIAGWAVGTVAGTLVGGLVGASASESDIEVSLSVPAERSALKKLARFPDKEPKSFQLIK
jgi:small nuclear ribonucleoprotein (snRNP)-like protein